MERTKVIPNYKQIKEKEFPKQQIQFPKINFFKLPKIAKLFLKIQKSKKVKIWKAQKQFPIINKLRKKSSRNN